MSSTIAIQNRQLAVAATEGLRHLETADWTSSTNPKSEFLALVALRLVLAGYLIGSVSKTTQADGTTTIAVEIPGGTQPADRLLAARSLIDPLAAYLSAAGLSFSSQLETGAVPIPVLIVGGAVAVTAIVAEAYVVSFACEKASEVVDKALTRDAAAKEVQRADAEVIKLVNNHVAREQAAGRRLQIDDATMLALTGLQSRIGSLVKNAFSSEAKSILPPWVLPAAGVAAAAAIAFVLVHKGRKQNV